MATILKKLPDVIGFYLPGDRSHDFDGRVLDPKTGELVYQPSMTKQSFVAECDINNIVRDFTPAVMAQLTLANLHSGRFEDLPDVVDYQESLEIARAGQQAFELLPAQVRARFNNDPAAFLDFMGDPANQDEAIELGLAVDNRPPGKAPVPASEPEPKPEPPKA